MANVSRINGLRPVRYRNGRPYNGTARKYFIASGDSTAVYVGDVVKLASGGSDTDGTCQQCALASAGDAVVGVVVAVERDADNLHIGNLHRAASTNRYVWVADDPDLLFEAEVSNGSLAAADIGLNVNHAVGSPNATTSTSGAYIDAGTEDTTATLTFKLHGFASRPDNEIGASAKVLVSINNHQFGSGTGTAGV